ncbi:hypothetical protein KGA66_23715 [Actinocrinis puniceicyclus]|uniref:Uncharacterized protein n=1 Tax=Actinocrinis puniceicyclus TaxID=977794 RepID=A0A8J7WPA9_9ACTN|nr:hypothetical protein [Actinocrinis puniceicyclus]MBS2966073.1 hypothetical protein [Actinocrinis puniceicyclus]
MNLWEQELAPYNAALEQLTAPERLSIAVSALDWTLRHLPSPSPIEPEARAWIDAAMQVCRDAAAAGAPGATLPDQLSDAYEDIDQDVEDIGTGQLLMGVSACGDFDVLTAKSAFAILYSCYTAFQNWEGLEEASIEQEAANARCLEVIALHKQLIDQAAG